MKEQLDFSSIRQEWSPQSYVFLHRNVKECSYLSLLKGPGEQQCLPTHDFQRRCLTPSRNVPPPAAVGHAQTLPLQPSFPTGV